jgi:hypothetical protein
MIRILTVLHTAHKMKTQWRLASPSAYFIFRTTKQISIKYGNGRYILTLSCRTEPAFRIMKLKNCDSSVGIATGYRPGDQGVGVRVPVGSRIFSSPRPDRLWGPPGLLTNEYSGLFPRETISRGVKLPSQLQLVPWICISTPAIRLHSAVLS